LTIPGHCHPREVAVRITSSLFVGIDWENLKDQVVLFGGAGMKKIKTVLVLGFLALLIVPVLVTQIAKPERRSFEWVELGDTNFLDVRFENTAQNIELAGMLFVPEGEGPFPAAVIIHGSGTSHRDSGWYLTLTQYLQENGVVVLLPDKRGSELSEGDWRTASFEDLATDSVAAVNFLKKQEETTISGIGVVGLSEGGHFAPGCC